MRTEFTQWLNSQRDLPVAEAFHEIQQRVDALLAAEREACAKACDEIGMFSEVAAASDVAWDCAQRVRARATNKPQPSK